MRQVYGTKVTRLTLGGLPLVSGVLPASRGVGTGRQESAEAVVAGSTGEGPNMKCRTEAGLSMVRKDAEDGAGTLRAHAESSGRKPRGQALGASSTTAGPSPSRPEANERLMEMILSRENMMAAYRRVVGNKGAPGIDKMTVAQLKPYLSVHWPRIRESCWRAVTGRRRCAGWKSPSPAARGCANWGDCQEFCARGRFCH